MQKTLLVIIGPTAVGKTALSIELAKRLGTEIVSGDSRQFYQEMSIGTAKPTEEELAMVPHHFINNRSIKEYYSAGDFEKEALEKIETLFLSHDFVVAIGGSGLYMKALCEGLDEVPPVDMVLRNELISAYQNQGLGYLQERMLSLNPEKLKRGKCHANRGVFRIGRTYRWAHDFRTSRRQNQTTYPQLCQTPNDLVQGR